MSTETNPTSKLNLEQPSTTDVERIVTNNPDAKERRTGFSKREKLFATIGALGLLGGGAAAANYISSTAGHDTDKDPGAVGPATPGVNETTAPTASAEPSPYASPANTAPLETMKPIETASTLELEAGQSDTELATDFTESLREWNNAGVDTIIEYRRTSGTGKSAEEVAAEVAQANQKKFVQALFGDEIPSTPEIAKFTTDMTTANENTLKYAILTDPSLSLANEENYMRNRKIVSPVENRSTTDAERTLVFTMETSSNYKKTSFRDKQTDQDDVAVSTYTVSFNTEGDKEKVSRISFVTK